jgi:hypothetical protein
MKSLSTFAATLHNETSSPDFGKVSDSTTDAIKRASGFITANCVAIIKNRLKLRQNDAMAAIHL